MPATGAACVRRHLARADGATTRSIGETAPARVPTVRLMELSVRRCTAESAAIEDIPSSM
jgi:hypothetical protein